MHLHLFHVVHHGRKQLQTNNGENCNIQNESTNISADFWYEILSDNIQSHINLVHTLKSSSVNIHVIIIFLPLTFFSLHLFWQTTSIFTTTNACYMSITYLLRRPKMFGTNFETPYHAYPSSHPANHLPVLSLLRSKYYHLDFKHVCPSLRLETDFTAI
jgi:hypothetical protein